MKITIEEYKEEWKINFHSEKELIISAFSEVKFEIEHIGSTSIEGLGAKPVIDILIGLHDFSIANDLIEKLMHLGYQYISQYEDVMPDRRFFIKEREGVRTHHIHMVEIHKEFWERHLAFRDYLRTHPAEKKAYYALKKELANKDWKDGNEYADAKSAFIRDIEQKANE